MPHVSESRKGRDDFETSRSKLVCAFLAVAEESLAEKAATGQEKPQIALAAGPAKGVVARSDTPQQGATDRGCGRLQSEPTGRTKRRSA